MKKSRFTNSQIINALKRAASGHDGSWCLAALLPLARSLCSSLPSHRPACIRASRYSRMSVQARPTRARTFQNCTGSRSTQGVRWRLR